MCMGKKKTTQQTSMQQTTTPINPAWVEPQVQTMTGGISGLMGKDPSQFVAGANPLLQQAAQTAGAMQPNTAGYDNAADFFQRMASTSTQQYDPATVKPNSILPNLSAYMSPYTEDVVDASLADFDFGAGQAVAEAKLGRATSDTFGGSGGDVMMGSTLSGLARGRGTLSGTLRDQGFQTGAGLANLDADRRQQAQLANMAAFNRSREFNASQYESALQRQLQAGQGTLATAQARDQAGLANLGAQTGLGSIMQQIDQAKAGAPVNVAGELARAYGSLTGPLSLLHGEKVEGTSNSTSKSGGGGLFGTGIGLGEAAQAAALFFSDERLKDDIETIGHDAKGRRWVSYRYQWDEPGTRREGVIAQEVAKTDPSAVVQHESGYLMVNYAELV